MNEITKMIVVLTVVCAVAATLLAGLKQGLSARISRQEDIYVRGPALHALLKDAPNDPLSDKVTLEIGGKKVSVYPWIQDGKVKEVALETVGQGGYGGDVAVITAIDLETGKIAGVRVTQQKETPGVGSRATEPSYLSQYKKFSIDQSIKLKSEGGEVDALSGATHTSTAIADAVNKAAKLVADHKEQILDKIKQKA
jgi:electron transport complex protein RnfG